MIQNQGGSTQGSDQSVCGRGIQALHRAEQPVDQKKKIGDPVSDNPPAAREILGQGVLHRGPVSFNGVEDAAFEQSFGFLK
jgi:hypothetical protein